MTVILLNEKCKVDVVVKKQFHFLKIVFVFNLTLQEHEVIIIILVIYFHFVSSKGKIYTYKNCTKY